MGLSFVVEMEVIPMRTTELWSLLLLRYSKAVGDPTMSKELDKVTSRNPFKPHAYCNCNSVI